METQSITADFRFPDFGFAINLDDPKWELVGKVSFEVAISQIQVALGLRSLKTPPQRVYAINAQSIDDWDEGESICILADKQRGTASAYIRQDGHIVAYRYNSEEMMRECRRQQASKSQ